MKLIGYYLSALVLLLTVSVVYAAAPVQQATSWKNGSVAFRANCTVGDLVTLWIGDASGTPIDISAAFQPVRADADWLLVAQNSMPDIGGWLYAVQCTQRGEAVTWRGTAASRAIMTEWSGGEAAEVENTAASVQEAGSTISPGPLTTLNADDLIVSLTYATDSAIRTPRAPWAGLMGIQGSSTNPSATGAYRAVSTTGTFEPWFALTSGGEAVAGQGAWLSGTSLINEVGGQCLVGGDTGRSEITIYKPANGIVKGNLLIAGLWGYTGDSTGLFTQTLQHPPGWVAIKNAGNYSTGTYQQNVGWFYHVITNAAAEPASYTWTAAQKNCRQGSNCDIETFSCVGSFSGVSTTAPIDAATAIAQGNRRTTPTIQSLTTTQADDLLVAWFIDPDEGEPIEFPVDAQGGFVSGWHNDNTRLGTRAPGCCTNAWFDQARPTAGATGLITSGVSGDGWVALGMALRPERRR
jgi:hypothetical protein